MSNHRPVQLGLCCLNTTLRAQKPSVWSARSMIIKSIEKHGLDQLREKIIQNLRDTLVMIEWNEQNGIKVFRLSSEIFPHKSNPKVEDYSFDFAIDLLKEIGALAKSYGQRLTFHPGPYNVIGSPNANAYKNTIADLDYHAEMLDLMELDQHSVMVVHGGGIYGNKSATIDRWCDQYNKLPERVKRRLVLENCEKNFSIEDCLNIAKRIDIPIVFDIHHYNCYCQLHPSEDFKHPSEYIADILYTWTRRSIKPKFHISEQGEGKVGHHSDFIDSIPNYLLNIPEKYGVDIDLMIEAKMKEQAIMQLYQKYPQLNCQKLLRPQYENLFHPDKKWVKRHIQTCECCA